MSRMRNISLVFLGLLATIVLAAMLSLPIWRSHHYASLKKELRILKKDKSLLNDQLALTKFQLSTLQRRNKLEFLGQEKFGLGYFAMPIRVEDFIEE